MKWTKKFWIVFLSFLPFGAGAVAPFIYALAAGAVSIAGFSIYRSNAPVDFSDAVDFFSSCWTCQIFSDVMSSMSYILPPIYKSIGQIVAPMAAALTAIWFAWQLINKFMDSKSEQTWNVASNFGVHVFKLMVLISLLLAPLPKIISSAAIEPIFNVGLSLNRIATEEDGFDKCVVATAILDRVSGTPEAATAGAFSPKLRHNLACELAGVHRVTGLGMATGWTMLNMAFDYDYMHKILWKIPIFPNIFLIFAGALVLGIFFMALLPIPVYFLEVFIQLSLDLVMLPIMLLSWLFKDWKIMPQGASKSIRKIIDDVVSATVGIAMTGIFLSFAIMFINAAFGDWQGFNALSHAIETNDSIFLMDALMANNETLIVIIMMGLFLAAFMTAIPALIKTLFNAQVSDKFYETTKNNVKSLWEYTKKINKNLEK